ncbi:MAG: hypothetical protein HYW05_03375 [Candidatus Diapherotrites archaeon]|nr:hypothetical protein [Candidatus Diapherotrites archaeon]
MSERYYKHIPLSQKVRRAKSSQSFLKTLNGKYIIHGNKKIFAQTFIDKERSRINLVVHNADKQLFQRLCNFEAIKTKEGWNVYHRYLHDDYHGLNLGRLGFRLIEIAIKKHGGKEIFLEADRKDVINTVLGLGWNIAPKFEVRFKNAIGLEKSDSLPSLQEIRTKLRQKSGESLGTTIRLMKECK